MIIKNPSIVICLFTFSPIYEWELGEVFLKQWQEKYPMLFPERLHFVDRKYDVVENIDSFKPFWLKADNFYSYRKSKIKSYTHSFFGGVDYKKSSKILLDFTYDPKIDWRKVFYDLASAYGSCFGYLHLITDKEVEQAQPYGQGASNFFKGVIPVDRVRGFPALGLPHLGWLTFYGREFLDLIGKNISLLPAEFCTKEDDNVFIQLSKNINDLITNYEKVDATRLKLKEIIGLEYFQTYPDSDPNMKFADYFFKE